jgi:hypothetical protein
MKDTPIIRCDACLGTKQVPGMGGIHGECYKCDGEGYLLVDQEEVKKEKRDGRSKKNETA